MSEVRAAWMRRLESIAGLRISWDEPLSRHTSFKIGGPADAFVWADTRDQLEAVARIVREESVPLLAIGRGTNLLVDDDGFRGIVLRLGKRFESVSIEGSRLRAGASVPMSVLSKEAAKHGLAGVEFAFGIPGSVGGGVRMNAGAHGRCMADVVVDAEALDWEYRLRVLTASELKFAYRTSSLGDYVCATEALFALEPDDPNEVERRTKSYYNQRRATQPLSMPSAGCVFRNPDVGTAGKLIDECGLKGFAIGGARVSEIHANYIVAEEGATARDVHALIDEVRRRVRESTGADLELEVKIIGPQGPTR